MIQYFTLRGVVNLKKIILILTLITLILITGCNSEEAVENNDPESLNEEQESNLEIIVKEDSIPISEAVGKAKEEKIVFEKCEDSDGGLNYEQAGQVKVNYEYKGELKSTSFPDHCEGNNLNEYVCENDKQIKKTHGCPVSCTDSKCTDIIRKTYNCVFNKNVNVTHNCQSDQGGCNGIEKCRVILRAPKGSAINFKNSCNDEILTFDMGNYNQNSLTFDCPQEPNEEI